MGISKFFYLILLLILGYFAIKKLRNSKPKSSAQESVKAISLVTCAYCDTRIPENQAYIKNDLSFCDYQHASLYQKSHSDT